MRTNERRFGAGSLFCAASLLVAAIVPVRSVAQSPEPTYGYVFTPPAQTTGAPAIIKVELNSDHLRAGGPIDIRVTTTSDVVRVVTGSGKRSGMLTMDSPGVFTSESNLPHLGGLATIHIKLHFQAFTQSGTSTALDVPVSYR